MRSKSDWSKIQIIGLNRYAPEDKKWIAKEINLGERYIDPVKSLLSKPASIRLNNYNPNNPYDVLYINPLDIIYIHISRKIKIVHLNKPFANHNNECL